jgi:hypothetical protein
MTFQTVIINKDTKVVCVDIDLGNEKRLRDDFLDILKNSNSDVPFTIKTDDTIGNMIIRIEVYYNDNNLD